jgi:hypothetical protein
MVPGACRRVRFAPDVPSATASELAHHSPAVLDHDEAKVSILPDSAVALAVQRKGPVGSPPEEEVLGVFEGQGHSLTTEPGRIVVRTCAVPLEMPLVAKAYQFPM